MTTNTKLIENYKTFLSLERLENIFKNFNAVQRKAGRKKEWANATTKVRATAGCASHEAEKIIIPAVKRNDWGMQHTQISVSPTTE